MPTCATLWISLTCLNTIKEAKQLGGKPPFFHTILTFNNNFGTHIKAINTTQALILLFFSS